MNRLLTEFNDTVGKEKGILLNVTNMTNSAAIGGQLQDAKAGKPGALDLPDLFSAHPSDASGLGIEDLVDWNDWFTAEDMAAYVPGFVQDGIIEGRQVVFPVSKSTQLIFLNGSQYARFAADTGAQLSTLATWDGFFEMAAAVFLRWLTEQQRNLEFAADTGYMPVSSAAFDAIADYPFEQRSYQRLYDVYNEMRLQNTPPPVRAGHRGVPRQGKGIVRQSAPAPEGLPPAPCQRRNAGSPDRGDLAAAV